MSELKQALRGRELFTLAFGTIIGVGWITVLGHWLGNAGSLGAILAFVAGAMLVLTVGLCYAEVASMMPAAGGEVVYARRTFGPAAGFAAGWVLSLIYISVVAFEAISVGWISTVLIPGIEGPLLYRAFGADVHLGNVLIGFAGMVVIGYMNYRGARAAAVFQLLMTLALLLISVAFITVGLAGGDPANLRPLYAGATVSEALAGATAVFVTTPFWFAGFNVLPQAAGETAPDVSMRRVGLVIVLSILGAAVFYVLVILASSMTLPRGELLAFELPAAAAFRAAFDSPLLGNLVLLAGLLGLITTWNAVVFSAARVLLALSRAGELPVGIGVIHARYGTPGRAILFVTCVAALLMLLGRGAIGIIVNTVGACFALMFLTVAAVVIRLRIREPAWDRPYRAPGGLIVPVLAALFAVSMLGVSLWEHSNAASGFPAEWIVLVTWALLGLLFRAASSTRRGSVK